MYDSSGVYVALQSVAGCDSIIILDLTINSSYSGDTIVLTACDSALWNTLVVIVVECMCRYATDASWL